MPRSWQAACQIYLCQPAATQETLGGYCKNPFCCAAKKYLAMPKADTYIAGVQRFPLHILGRFLPKLGGAFGHRPFFWLAF
jgi:hypothetical protein